MKPVVSFAVFFFLAVWIQECRAVCVALAGTETNITCRDSTRSADGLLWRAERWEIIDVANCTRPGSCVSLYPDSFDASLNNSTSYLTIKNASRTHPFNMDGTRWFCTYHTDGYDRTSCRYDYFHVLEKAKNFTCGPMSVDRTTWELSITCSTERIYPWGNCLLGLRKTKTGILQGYLSADKSSHSELNDTLEYYRTECSFKFSFGYLGIYGKYYKICITPLGGALLDNNAAEVCTEMREIQLGPVDCYPLVGTETNITCYDSTRSAGGLLWRAEVEGEIKNVANCTHPGSCVSRYPDSFDAFLDGEGSYLTIKNASRTHPFNMDTRWFCSYHSDGYNLTSCSHMYVLEKAKNLTCGPWSLVNSTSLELSITCSTERIYPGGVCVLLLSNDKYNRIPLSRVPHTSNHTELNDTLEYYRTECLFEISLYTITRYKYYYYRVLMAPTWAFYTKDEAAYVYTEMKEIELDCPRTNYGRFCDGVCSTNCANQYCSGEIGTCDECPQGRTGDYCDEDCPRTHYGRFCDGVCSTNCINQFCSGDNGTCDDCPPGKTGDYCDEECPRTNYGLRCEEICSINCTNQYCSGDNGTCDDCPQGKTGDYCDKDLCPKEFCKNEGRCVGLYTCDCTSTDFFGPTCQNKSEQLPVNFYTFTSLDPVKNVIITSSGNLTYNGSVTIKKQANEVSLVIPSGSYITLEGPVKTSCLDQIDTCTSGFTITTIHSFSSVSSTETQVALTTGAVLEDGVKGVSLYYKSGSVYCHVVTLRRQWSIVQNFHLIENEWYNMTVSWHMGQGLDLLKGNNVIGSNVKPNTLTEEASSEKPLLIGSEKKTSPTAEMNVNGFILSPVFWREIQRAGIYFAKEPSLDSSPLETAQIVGIAVGCLAAIVFSTVAVVGLVHHIRKDSRKQSGIEQSTFQTPNPQGDDGYITPIDSAYSMEYIIPPEDYLSPVDENIYSSADYDYIKHDYLTLQPETTLTTPAPALPDPRAVSKR